MFYFDTISDGKTDKKILKSSIFDEFQDKFEHLFTTKESFIKTEEEKFKSIAKSNRALILEHLKIKEKDLFQIKQTHTANIALCTKTPNFIDETDGVILKNPNNATILNFADCTPVILYDPKNNIAAGLHAGWRGTAGEICKKGLLFMKEKFNSKPKEIIAAIGPCISQNCFETGEEVYEALKKTIKNDEEIFNYKNEKFYPDLAKINAQQLKEEGVENIDICHFKTTIDNEYFFSYRMENKTTSRISMVIKINCTKE